MIDIDTHKIIDLLPTRNPKDVSVWLKSFPNLQIISRDGSLSYKSAIDISHPDAIQVSDRFHLLKNLTDYCCEYLKKYLKYKISFEPVNSGEIVGKSVTKNIKSDKLPYKNKLYYAVSLFNQGITKTKICKDLNMDIRTLIKILSMLEKEILEYTKSRSELKREERKQQKSEIIDYVRALSKKGCSQRKIADLIKISRKTVHRYLDPNVNIVHSTFGSLKNSILNPFKEKINELSDEGFTSKKILQIITEKGYEGSSSLLRTYISKKKKEEFCMENTKTKKWIHRNILLKRIFKQPTVLKNWDDLPHTQISEQYPNYKKIVECVDSFRKLLKDKNLNELETWIAKTKGLCIKELDSFITGISRDLDAVKNAIKYEYNNGLAEGSVNKLKVIKRIMYGRNSFELLRNKVLLLEKT